MFAAENGVSAAAREFNTTRKTARLWMNRLAGDAPASTEANQTKQSADIQTPKDQPNEKPIGSSQDTLTETTLEDIIPPRKHDDTADSERRLKIVRRNSTFSKRRKTELLELNRDITPVLGSRVRGQKLNKNITDELPPRRMEYQNGESGQVRCLQFDVLNLEEVPSLSEAVASGKIPGWQLTAVETASGAAWVSFCYELNIKAGVKFLKNLSSQLKHNGINQDKIYVSVNPESELGKLINLPGGEDFVFPASQNFAGFKEGNITEYSPRFTTSSFHANQFKELYMEALPKSTRKFVDAVYAYMLRSGYEKKPDKNALTPPYQLLCRLENGYCREDILNYRPRLLDFPKRSRTSPRAGFKSIFGSMASLWKTAFSRGNVQIMTENRSESRETGPITIPASNPDKTGPINAEFMNLKSIDWKKSPAKPVERTVADRRRRNRQEIIEQARAMLKARASESELKSSLPITDGELAMVKQRLSVSK